jgi:hypothetical protein
LNWNAYFDCVVQYDEFEQVEVRSWNNWTQYVNLHRKHKQLYLYLPSEVSKIPNNNRCSHSFQQYVRFLHCVETIFEIYIYIYIYIYDLTLTFLFQFHVSLLIYFETKIVSQWSSKRWSVPECSTIITHYIHWSHLTEWW